MIFETYYSDTFQKWVDHLATKIGNREEAEDKVQEVFTRLFPRKDFCEDLIEKGEMDAYIQGAINLQPAQVFREQIRQVPTVSIDADNIDFLSSIRADHPDCEMGEIELDDFYETAIKLLENDRKLPDNSFETEGELWQYIFVQHCRNGRTFEEIRDFVGCSHQNISAHFKGIVTILTPLIKRFIGGKLNSPGNEFKWLCDKCGKVFWRPYTSVSDMPCDACKGGIVRMRGKIPE